MHVPVNKWSLQLVCDASVSLRMGEPPSQDPSIFTHAHNMLAIRGNPDTSDVATVTNARVSDLTLIVQPDLQADTAHGSGLSGSTHLKQRHCLPPRGNVLWYLDNPIIPTSDKVAATRGDVNAIDGAGLGAL